MCHRIFSFWRYNCCLAVRSIKSIADSWGVSRTTIYRYINKF
ncbi:helix-turn-helix domain-containing protein [Lactococcus lactis subsp. cremoris]|nr:helix-turn-helix domain-containing protein [Lactococcus cremoris]